MKEKKELDSISYGKIVIDSDSLIVRRVREKFAIKLTVAGEMSFHGRSDPAWEKMVDLINEDELIKISQRRI